MTAFHEQLIEAAGTVWQAILSHPFLKMTADGTVPDETFKTWMQQDYVFVREAIPFTAVLLAKAPLPLRPSLSEVIPALNAELDLFAKNAQAHGIELEDVQPAPTCHAYLQFLMATAYGRSFEEGFTVLYAAEKAYLDSWMEVKKNQRAPSPWQSFIDNWTSEAFQQYVGWLATTLDDLATGKPESDRRAMQELFLTTARYEYLFWEMAATREQWPTS